jgi:Homeodomain-like domain
VSTPTAEQLGDLAESLMPVAAKLACIVHDEGGVEDVQQLLDGFGFQELTGLAVVLASLVDPATRTADALSYLVWDEHGQPTMPPDVVGTIRGLAGHRPRVVKLRDPRRDARRLHERGLTPEQIAAHVRVTERTVFRWIKAWRQEAEASA